MANRIKGITIEIGGDTTKLEQSLKKVNGTINQTQSQLRDVQKLLKLDPGNAELLAQRQRLLGEAVSGTEEKLKSLKEAARSANDALADGKITQTQYDALQREIVETEKSLKNLEKQAEQSATALQKISATGTSLQKTGGQIESVGKAILPVSATITGIGAAGIKVASDFEKAMSEVRAVTGLTAKEGEEDFERLKNKAEELGAKTAFSATEVASAMTEMAKAGWDADQIFDGMAGVLDATAASGESLGSVATIVADALTGFGMEAKESARVADLMTQAANSGTIGITDLGESYKYIAPIAQSLNLSIEDVTTAISAMSMAGIKGSQAGTSLRTVLANMTKPSSTVSKAMDDLNISITNSDGSFKSLDEIITIMRTSFSGLTDDQKAYYATCLAGKEGMSGLISILNLSQEKYDEIAYSMNNCKDVAQQTAEVMQDNLQSRVEQLGGALESLAIALAEHVIPFLTKLVEWITSVVEAFTNLNPMIQKVILFIGGVIAVAGPLLVIVGKVIGLVGTIMTLLPQLATFITAVKTAFAALTAVLQANAFGFVVIGIMAAVSAISYLWNHCDGFREFCINILEKLKNVLSNALSNFTKAVITTVSNIRNSIITGFNQAVAFVKSLAKNAYTWGKDIIEGIVNGIKACIGKVKNAVKNVAETIRSFLHFSVPDEGPLTDYESWMPDFMEGLAKGIEQSRNMVAKAVDSVATDMVISPKMELLDFTNTTSDSRFSSSPDHISGIVSAITDALNKFSPNGGDVVIPIYLGGTMLDEVVVNAQQRANLRSGGR